MEVFVGGIESIDDAPVDMLCNVMQLRFTSRAFTCNYMSIDCCTSLEQSLIRTQAVIVDSMYSVHVMHGLWVENEVMVVVQPGPMSSVISSQENV